jgi:hypothetical protein
MYQDLALVYKVFIFTFISVPIRISSLLREGRFCSDTRQGGGGDVVPVERPRCRRQVDIPPGLADRQVLRFRRRAHRGRQCKLTSGGGRRGFVQP